MKNYALYYKRSDYSKFIKDYLKNNNKLEIEMADGSKAIINYSKSAESKIINKIENQVKFTKKAKIGEIKKTLLFGSLMTLCALAIPFNIMVCSFWPCIFLSGLSLAGVYTFAGLIKSQINILKSIKKERIYMANKKKFKKRGISIKQASAMKLRKLKKMAKGFGGTTSRKNLKIENIKFKKEQYETFLDMIKYFQKEEFNKNATNTNDEEVIEESANQKKYGTI